MKNKISLLVVIFCLNILTTFAQGKSGSPSFTFKPLVAGEKRLDSIVVYIAPVLENYGRQLVTGRANLNGIVEIKLPKMYPINYISFYFYYEGERGAETAVKNYYVEPTDKLIINYTKSDSRPTRNFGFVGKMALQFSGRGSLKYELVDQLWLQKDKNNLICKKFSLFNGNNGNKERYKSFRAGNLPPAELKKSLDTLYNINILGDTRLSDIIAKYSNKLSSNLINFLKYEFNYGKNYQYFGWLHRDAKSDADKKMIKDFYFSKPYLLKENFNNSWSEYGYWFIFNKFREVASESYMISDGKGQSYAERYQLFKAEKNQKIREILITKMILGSSNNYISSFESQDSCLSDALATVTNPYLNSVIFGLQKRFKKGTKVFKFSFQDTTGKLVTLNDLKGKVFVLDIFGAGCTGCVVWFRRFKSEIYPEFKNHKDFEAVSLSLDKSKEIWIDRTLKSGLFTDENHINLFIDGFMDNPMIKYYEINSIPFILLVDKKGNIITRIDTQSSTEISSMIRKALDEPI